MVCGHATINIAGRKECTGNKSPGGLNAHLN